ncbi:diguanylate cyclase [Methylobacterium sp. NEAU 140]|uniref:diguanylate cyclase domain-containing protein n=1 Tax=Methylobacterium sp. NEAU 140 TaxID=3064945 RepID=UPI0027333501|nr:diguanylate cyclase [Methylobacterium sp. NEAU 140]MDP4023287.1 diguanylate cyclase [Methylobacterium sp. NEAU 140]
MASPPAPGTPILRDQQAGPPDAAGGALAARLLRVIFGCYFAVATVVTAGQMITEYRSAHRRLEADIQAMERTFGPGLADALWGFNERVLRGILNGIAEMPVVVGVEVRDERGRLVERAVASHGGRRVSGLFDRPFARDFDLVYRDEVGRPHPVGRWTVRSNDGIAFDQVTDTLVVILINSVLKTLALWVIFWAVVRRMVGRPLAEISRFVRRLDADSLGARPLRLTGRGGHELHLLAEVFNGMAAKLRRAFDDNAALMRDLREANATLQARVEERTRDLARLARTDQLTGLDNRRALDERLAQAAPRAAGGPAFSLVLCDIDHFKGINDRYGHAVGDAVLVAFAGTLRGGIRPGDALGRWGGEEFMILCPGAGLDAARAFAEGMRRRVEAAEMPGIGVRTCSFGVAELHAGESVDGVLARADAALYAAKRNGRNRVEAAGLPLGRRSAA